MATRALLKLKRNLDLPLRFFRHPASVLVRSLAPFARPEDQSLFKASTFQFPGMIARQMGTKRSPRGVSRKDDEEEEDMGDNEDDFDDEWEDFDGDDFDDEEEEEEQEDKPRGKKTYGRK